MVYTIFEIVSRKIYVIIFLTKDTFKNCNAWEIIEKNTAQAGRPKMVEERHATLCNIGVICLPGNKKKLNYKI